MSNIFIPDNKTKSNLSTNSNFILARVKSVILDDTHPRFKELGGWSAIGTIEFEITRDPFAASFNVYNTARPFYPNFKQYPLENEIVLLIDGLDKIKGQTNVSDQESYYVSVYNLWNTPHQNALPNPITPSENNSNNYLTSFGGVGNNISNQEPSIDLGPGFVEQNNIHPSKAYPGDVIYEGRWGQSIRFGSTAENPNANSWSSTGPIGSPITIIKNGQVNTNTAAWIPQTDEINGDDASIYLASTQKIPLKSKAVEVNQYFSYPDNAKPTAPDQYAGKQIIFNSGRLVFNTTQDHLLLSSQKSIGLSAVDSINFDTPGPMTLQASDVFLGSKNATQQVLYGNDTVSLLSDILNELITLTQNLSIQIGVPPGAPLEPTRSAAQVSNIAFRSIQGRLQTLLSNSVRTI
jgi:hypothetical protein